MNYHLDFEAVMSRKLVISELVAKNARKFPDREAIVAGDRRYTWYEFDQRANRVGNALLAMGVNPEDKVSLLAYNSAELVECFVGVSKIGAAAVPLNYRLAPEEIKYCVNNSDSKVFIFDYRFLQAVQEVKAQLPSVKRVVVVGTQVPEGMDDYEILLQAQKSEYPEIIVNDDDAAFVLYTSGTTGRPKGAVLSHKNLLLNGIISCFEAGMQPGYSQVCVTPLYHTAAITATISHFFLSGKTVLLENFNPQTMMETIAKEKANRIFMVPAMWQAIMQLPDLNRYDCSTLRNAGTGAAIMPIQLKKQIMQQFPNVRIFDNFGQTEMSPSTTTLKPEFAERKQGSVGQPFTLVEFRVLDDEGHDVPTGEIGEIVYRGPTMLKEYYNNPEATAEAFAGGWFHSGDLVRVDEEGFVYIVDRKKDMVISGGENIYPAEIEAVLYSHPKILETAVIGVPHEKWGEAPKALVVLRTGESMTEQEVIDFCAEHLARYKRPQSVEFMASLPRNASGKVLKRELRKVYGNPMRY